MVLRTVADRTAEASDYWYRFEARLRDHAETGRDAETRVDTVVAAHGMFPSARNGLDPEAFADLAYRLRFGLGSTIETETLAEIRRSLEIERERLISEGVSPQLLT